MKQQKITPKARHEILVRYRAGEKQVVLAREYEVDKSYISRIVKNTKPEMLDGSKLADTPGDELLNRYKACLLELRDCNQHLYDASQDVQHLQLRIKTETERLEKVSDAGLSALYRTDDSEFKDAVDVCVEFSARWLRDGGVCIVRLLRFSQSCRVGRRLIPSKDSLI